MFVAASFCLSRNSDKVATALIDCDFSILPHPKPYPQRTWYKDDELVYSTLSDSDPNDTEFLAANPLLAMGIVVLDPSPFHQQLIVDGSILLHNRIENVTSLPPGVATLKEAREKLFTLLLGNWTCKVNNTLGSTSRTYIIKECGKG